MLPSLRLIVAGFLCGFVVVYAGLRMATSLNAIHQAFPITVAQAAAAPAAGTGPMRAAAPLLYDMRFVTSSTAGAPVLASVTSGAPEWTMPPTLPAQDVRTVDDAPPEPGPANSGPELALATPVIEPMLGAMTEPPSPPAVAPDPSPTPAAAPGEPAVTPPVPQVRPITASIAPVAMIPSGPVEATASETMIPAAPMEAIEPAPPEEPTASVAPDAAPKAATANPRSAAKPVRKRHRLARRVAKPSKPFANPSGDTTNATYNWK